MQSNIENDSNSDHVSINVDSLFSKFTSDNPSITGSRSELFVEEEDEEESRNWQTYSNNGGLSICPTVSDADVIEYYNNVSPSFQGLTAEHINSRRCQSPIGPIPEREHNALRISESVGIGIFSGETTNDFRSENEDKCAEIQSAGETTSVSAKRTQAEFRSEPTISQGRGFTGPSNDNVEFNHFYNETPESDHLQNWNFNDMYVRSNSPMASNCNSDIESDVPDFFIEDEFPNSSSQFGKRLHKTSLTTDSPMSPAHRESSTVNLRTIFSTDAPNDTNNSSRASLFQISNDPHRINNGGINGVHRDFNKDSDTYYSNRPNPSNKYKKFTYADIEKSLSRYYDKNEKKITKTDLLITYLTGMRTIYIISKNVTQLKSYSFAMSTISITICLAVVAPFIQDMFWSAYLISAGNALATILIFLSRYYKFDSNSAQYAFMTKQFNKLGMRVEYQSYIETQSSHNMREIESNMMELNEYIQELIPKEAAQLFPLICRTNILQFIKKIELYRKNLIIRFRDIKNEIHYILYKWNLVGENADRIDAKYKLKTPQQEREKNRVLYLMDLKETTKKELMQCKTIYNQIDELFKNEICYAETNQSCFGCSRVFKPDYDFSKLNPIVRDYLKLVTPD